jgi:hypothetical protein
VANTVRASDFSADWWFYWFFFRGVFDLSTAKFANKKYDLFSKKEVNFTTNEFKFEQKIELRGLF